MKNTLIIGEAGAGKTRKLKEMIKVLPNNVWITLCERTIEKNEISLNQNFNLLNENKSEVSAAFTEMIVKSPSVIVIEELQSFENIEIPYDIPVYATMQVETKEEATHILLKQAINIDFEVIVTL